MALCKTLSETRFFTRANGYKIIFEVMKATVSSSSRNGGKSSIAKGKNLSIIYHCHNHTEFPIHGLVHNELTKGNCM